MIGDQREYKGQKTQVFTVASKCCYKFFFFSNLGIRLDGIVSHADGLAEPPSHLDGLPEADILSGWLSCNRQGHKL